MNASVSMTGFEWHHVTRTELKELRDIEEIVRQCLTQRWSREQLNDPEWFQPSLKHLHDPFLMRGMEAAVQRLKQALQTGQRIRIITDYDVDGTTSSLILQATLKILGDHCALDYHIPDRFLEGYGFSTLAAERAIQDKVDLIITADIGIRDQAAVTVARQGGVDVLICDHHLPPGEDVPEGAMVLCPPQDSCSYPNPHLAACGVSLKLAQAMLADHPKRESILRSMLKLAAIGTISDMVPLTTRENRAIVSLGLHSLNQGRHNPGLQALLSVSGVQSGRINEGDIGFQIGPRINAAGRMADAKIVVELLTSKTPQAAKTLAERVDTMNKKRKEVQKTLVEQALSQISAKPKPFILVCGPEEEGWHRGVVGIVASRIMHNTHRPTAVLSIQGDRAVGSMRSLDGIHCVALLEQVSELLTRFGGHANAAGFTVPVEHLATLESRLCEAVSQTIEPHTLRKIKTYDVAIPADALSMELESALGSLGPFGMGNKKPMLLIRGVSGGHLRTLSGGKHLKLVFNTSQSRNIEAIWWNQGDFSSQMESATVDLLGQLELNEWRGQQKLQIQIEDVRLCAP